jgi:peptidoglycan hydrolase CwlO-like protein
VSYPRFLSDQIKESDILIDRQTYQYLLEDLESYDGFKQKFSQLQTENDSLFTQLQQQMANLDKLYAKADLLQAKLLTNQVELIRTEENLKSYKIRYQEYLQEAGAEERVRYRTRYIFRNRQERKWFYITWSIFIGVPLTVYVIAR